MLGMVMVAAMVGAMVVVMVAVVMVAAEVLWAVHIEKAQ
jgi:hypothetical protein